jgi:hypothetical protein
MNKPLIGPRFSLSVGLLMLASGMMMSNVSKAPAAPTNLHAYAVSSTQIKLTWLDNFSEDLIIRGSVFKIERCGGVECTNFTQIAQISQGRNVATYSNTGLTPNTAYRYRVRASHRLGESPYSNVAQATTQPPSGPDLVGYFYPFAGVCNYEQQENCLTACPYVTYSIGIKNQGDLSPSGQVTFTIKNTTQVLHTWTVPIPAAGEIKKIGWYKTFPWRCPGDPTIVGAPPNFFFTVDSQNALPEGNEQNNTTGKWIKHPELTTFGPN